MAGQEDRVRRSSLSSRLAGSSRRRVVGAALAIALVLGAAAAVATSPGTHRVHHPQQHLAIEPHGAAVAQRHWGSAAGGARSAGPAQDRLGPVLLVPGYGGDTGSLAVLASRIRESGRQATILRLPGTGTGSLVPDAALLNAAVERALQHGAPSVDIVGYSAGGVVALLWARRDGGAASARRVVTLGAPFHGTQLAAVARALLPRDCPAACQQLAPGSSLLGTLDLASPAGLPPWLSLWTTSDLVVTPPDSARLRGAIDVPVQAICPQLAVTHGQLPTNPAVVAMVLTAISRAPLARPTPAACG
jgi:pimeloyl-ACP methyl ester carboxylesterase